MAKNNDKQTQEVAIIDENSLKSKIYIIRGQKVMLDADLALIYGYETKTFNRQVQRNKVKFPSDMMFQLTEEEYYILRSKNLTSRLNNLDNFDDSTVNLRFQNGTSRLDNLYNFDDSTVNLKCQNGTSRLDNLDNNLRSQIATSSWGGVRKWPYVFTEQGIYMLMTVLKGPLATKQSIALVRLFKSMKDYIYENTDLFSLQERTNKLEINTKVIKQDLFEVKFDLKKVMDNFVDPSTYKSFLILDGKKIEADAAYINIYKKAKKTIYYIDNYINIKTLQLLSHCKENVEIIIFSDNLSKKDFVNDEMLNDFMIQNPTNKIKLIKTNNKFHDRYIILDYKYKNNSIYFCGYSSKDAGKKISSIIKIEDNKQIYYPLIDTLLSI